jgi:Tfp pilus assembly protein PilF
MPTWVFKNPPQVDEKAFAIRRLSLAETDAELGGYHLWSRDLADARLLIERALKNDPKLGLAHENMGFLDFADGKDGDAAREFAQAYDLDGRLYLSLFYQTMLAPLTHSDAPADEARLRDALLKTLQVNPGFAPAYVELARLALREDNLTNALAVARKAEQLEPSRAGYHLLCGQILLRQGRYAEAATLARYVAERWYQADHDEAVELWNAVPAAQRPGGGVPSEIVLQGTEAFQGQLKATVTKTRERRSISRAGARSSAFTARVAGWGDSQILFGTVPITSITATMWKVCELSGVTSPRPTRPTRAILRNLNCGTTFPPRLR